MHAVAGAPHGLRIGACPSAMPLVVEMGPAEERMATHGRQREGRTWFLSAERRETFRVYGMDDV